MTLDEEIDAAREQLYALYRKRRALRQAARPAKRKRLQEGETFAKLSNGCSLDAIAAEFQISLATVRQHLWSDISSQAYAMNSVDLWDNWQADYRNKLKINDTLPQQARLKRRRLWPWKAAVHEGVHWNAPCWNEEEKHAFQSELE
jgi:hypothetical protein